MFVCDVLPEYLRGVLADTASQLYALPPAPLPTLPVFAPERLCSTSRKYRRWSIETRSSNCLCGQAGSTAGVWGAREACDQALTTRAPSAHRAWDHLRGPSLGGASLKLRTISVVRALAALHSRSGLHIVSTSQSLTEAAAAFSRAGLWSPPPPRGSRTMGATRGSAPDARTL